MADDTVSLSLLTAAFNDKAAGARLEELLKTLNEVQEARKALAEEQEHANATLAEAKQLNTEAVALKGEADRIKAEFEQKNEGLAAAITTQAEQATAWGGERSAIEQGHRDTAAALDTRKIALDDHETDLAAREELLALASQKHEEREAELARREAALAEIVARLSPKAA